VTRCEIKIAALAARQVARFLNFSVQLPLNSLLRQPKGSTRDFLAGIEFPAADFRVRFFASGEMGEVFVDGFQFAANDADGIGSFNPDCDAVAGNPVDDNRDVATDDKTLSNLATEN
jgi:hypothetical protein